MDTIHNNFCQKDVKRNHKDLAPSLVTHDMNHQQESSNLGR